MKINPMTPTHYEPNKARKGNNSYEGRHVRKNNTTNIAKKAGGIAGGIAIGTTAALAMLVPGCQADKQVEVPETTPIGIYGETLETQSSNVDTNPTIYQPVISTKITTKPIDERKAVWHEVKSGDRLADIVKEYADLDRLTPDEELVPYYELLEADNPNKWSSRDKILIGTRFRVDSILPENIIKNTSSRYEPSGYDEETIPTEGTEETEPYQNTSAEDTVDINGNVFTFDLGTLDKKLFGDYEGLMYGKFVKLDKKMNGNIELTKYEGTNSDSNKSQVIIYDEDGKITEFIDYQNNEIVRTATYNYKPNTLVEKVTDEKVKSGLINVVTTEYDRYEDITISRVFLNGNDTIATFDFEKGEATIGKTPFVFDKNTFTYNDDVIGSKKYTGFIDGQAVRIDMLKNGICVEFVNNNGDIESRQQFDEKGNLIYTE